MMERNDRFFFVGLASLAVSLFLVPLALYILPHTWLGWNYHIPDFIQNITNYLQDALGVPSDNASWFIFYLLLFTGLIFAAIAYYAALHTRLDLKKELPPEKVNEAEVRLKQAKQNRREMIFLIIKIVFISIFVFIMAEIVQWAISVPA